MRDEERDQEDQGGRRAGRRHVGHEHEDPDDEARDGQDGQARDAVLGVEVPEHRRQRPVARHGVGDPGRGEEVGLQGGEHRQDAGDRDEPVAEVAEEAPRGDRDDAFRVLPAHLRDRLPGPDADRADQEDQRQVDRQGDGEREEHRPRDVARGILDLAGDRGDQVEALQRDEGEAHRLEQTGGPAG